MNKYSYSRMKVTRNRDEVIVRHCVGKRVLHIGACDSPYAIEKLDAGLLHHEHISAVATECVGIDIDEPAIRELAERGIRNIRYHDMNALQDLAFEPDVIVFGETIEHLQNIQTCLESLKRVMSDETRLIISTPNCCSFHFAAMAALNFEAIHGGHTVGFTYGLLTQLIRANGMEVDDFYFAFLPRRRRPWWLRIWQLAARLRPGFSETLLAICRRA